jgi:multiple sugar transport system permease protein
MSYSIGDRYQAYGLVAPAVIVLFGVAAYPVLLTAWLSLHRLILIFHDRSFIGLANYASLLHDARFWSALANTAYFVGVAVPLELVVGLLFALLLDSAVRGRNALRAAVLVPWAIPTVVSAKTWSYLFSPESGGIVGKLFAGVNWLGTPGYAMHAAILVDVWKTTPFVALLLLAGLQTIPASVYEAARVDGASVWRTLWQIKLPLIRMSVLIALLFRTLDAFRVFDSIYVLTQGGPANTTETLSIYTYKTLMRSGDFGYGSTLAVATFFCVALISVLYLMLFRKRLGGPV